MPRKKKPPEGHISHERWLVSYADFITLLFAFFTTMYAISNVDAQKMGKMVMSVRASFDSPLFLSGSDHLTLSSGTPGSGGSAKPDLVQPIRIPKDPNVRDSALRRLEELKSTPGYGGVRGGTSLGRLKRNIDALVGPKILSGAVETRLEGRGLIISLGEGGFFDSGSDQIRPEGLKVLDTIATGLLSSTSQIRIEGHTDNVPIRNLKFPSNWELSTARATAIVSYLIAKFGFEPNRISAAGYAEYRPTTTNDTPEGRARNRRVDIVVLNPALSQLEPR